MEDHHTSRNNAHRFIIQKVDDSGDIQTVDANGLTGEVFTGLMRLYPHGFSSVSPADAHMVMMGLGNRRDHGVAMGGEHPKYRPKNLGAGNTALYNADGSIMKLIGKNITVDASGTMTITVKTFVIKADKITLDGECHIGGTGGKPASFEGTTDSAGDTDVSDFATKVFLT